MINEDGKGALKMPCVHDQQPVQAFGSNRPHEAFRDAIRLRDLNRRQNDPAALGLKYGIKALPELAIVIPNDKTNWLRTLGECPGDLPRLLRDPLGVGMGGAARQVHAPRANFDEEQHVQPL